MIIFNLSIYDICIQIQVLYLYTKYLIIISLINYKIVENSIEHIRHALLYEYQLGHNAREASRNICQAIGKGIISRF